MRQLVELQRNADQFKTSGAEVVVVFREEKKGNDGLKTIQQKTKAEFTLALDTPADSTSAYSSGNKEFSSYVIDSKGVVSGLIKGVLRNRAKSSELLKMIADSKTAGETETNSSTGNDRAAVERACLDYVEGIYDVKPDLIKRGVHADLKKFGFWRQPKNDDFENGSAMTFDQLVELAATYNKDGKRIPKDAPKKVVVYEVMDKIATARLDAAWGTDLFHLIKEDGQWKILQVVWQSPEKK